MLINVQMFCIPDLCVSLDMDLKTGHQASGFIFSKKYIYIYNKAITFMAVSTKLAPILLTG